jgi:transcriptional regulator with XRE-family HTH domain
MCHERIRIGKPRPLPPGYPRDPKTFGERLRKRRLDVGLTQEELARRIGCWPEQVGIWERDQSRPLARRWPGILEVLGEDVLPAGTDFPSRLLAARKRAGQTQVEFAARVGVDPRTILNLERGLRSPHRRTLRKLAAIVGRP